MSAADVSLLLEKIPLEFLQLEPGQVICNEGRQTHELQFLISGEAESSKSLSEGRIVMKQRLGAGGVLFPDTLFGLHTVYPAYVKAATSVGIMRISKARYMQMLSLNSLYLVNYLNYLSYKAQTRAQVLTEGMTTSVGKYLKSLIIGLGERQALYTCFETNLKALSELTRQSPSVCETQLIEASAQKLLTVDASQASLRIFMRR